MALLSNRQRADASFASSQANILSALAGLKAAKDEKEKKARELLQDENLKLQNQAAGQSIEANAAALEQGKAERGLVSQFMDHMDRSANPAINGPVLPGEAGYNGPYSKEKYNDEFKYSVLAKIRTMRGKESTPEQIRSEYEANAAANAAALDNANAAPGLRALDLKVKTAQINNTDAATAKTKKETELLGVGKPMDAATELEKAKFTRQMKQDFFKSDRTRDFQTIETAANQMDKSLIAFRARVTEAAKTGKKVDAGGVDQILITLFNKLLDPSSVVRESEYARTPEGMSYLEAIKGKYEKFNEGGAGIRDSFRDELIASAGVLVSAAEDGFSETALDFINDAKSYGIDPERVVGGYVRYGIPKEPVPPGGRVPGVPMAAPVVVPPAPGRGAVHPHSKLTDKELFLLPVPK